MNPSPPLLVLRDRRGFTTLVLIGAILMCALGITNTFDAAPWPTPLLHRFLGAILALIFVPLSLLLPVKLFSGNPRMIATQDGITLWHLPGAISIRWADIAHIEPLAIPVRFGELKFIRIKVKPSAALNATFAHWSKMRRLIFQHPGNGFLVATMGSGRKHSDVLLELEQLRVRFNPPPTST